MSKVVLAQDAIPAMSDDAIANVRAMEARAMEMPQVEIETTHTLHGGTYTRTIMIPAGVALTGALIKIPTTLIVSGECMVYIGDRCIELKGYNVIPASAGRKQAFLTSKDTWLTMMFATEAQTIEQAEREFTDEFDLLGSHVNSNVLVKEGV